MSYVNYCLVVLESIKLIILIEIPLIGTLLIGAVMLYFLSVPEEFG